jgi:hypothetical protein
VTLEGVRNCFLHTEVQEAIIRLQPIISKEDAFKEQYPHTYKLVQQAEYQRCLADAKATAVFREWTSFNLPDTPVWVYLVIAIGALALDILHSAARAFPPIWPEQPRF